MRDPTAPSDPRSDDELLLASPRDPSAFGEFYDRHSDDVLAFLLARTGCRDTAADLMSETFAAALLSLDRYRPGGREAARQWLYGIAKNKLRQLHRWRRVDARARARLRVTARPTDEDLDRAEDRLDAVELRRTVARSVHALSPKLREAVTLRVVDDLPYPEVAARLGCSEQAARARVSRALSRLASDIDDPARPTTE